MTSEKSSLNPFGFTYRGMLRRFTGLPVPLTLFALFIYGEVIPTYFRYRSALSSGNIELARNIKGAIQFTFLSGSDESVFALGYSVLLIVTGFLLALFSFGFIMFRPTVNTQYSLGISRSGQFAARYLAAFTVTFISVVIPFLIIALFNAVFYGNTKDLWITFAFMCLSYTTIAMYSFTVFTFVMMTVGSFIESVVYGAVCFLSPALISRALYSLTSVMAYGSPLSGNTLINITFIDINGDRIPGARDSLFAFSKYIFPSLDSYGYAWIFEDEEYVFPPFARFAAFFVFVILLAAAAMLIHSRRKAEKAGFTGTCPAIEGFCVVTVGTWMASVAAEMLRSSDFSRGAVNVLTVLTGLVIMALGYTAVDLFVTRSLKAFRRRLWHLPLEICVFLCIVFTIGTVLYGAYSNIPQKEEIESASVSLPCALQDYRSTVDGAVAAGYLPVDSIISEQSSERVVFDGFESESDIEKILDLNNMIKDSGNDERGPYCIRFSYKLKNGREKVRIYNDAGTAALKKMTELMRSDVYKEKSAALLDTAKETKFGPVLLSPNLSSITVPKEIFNDRDKKDELFECVKKDILSGGIPLDLKTEGELLGYVGLTSQNPVPLTDEEIENGVTEVPPEELMLREDCDYLKFFEYNIWLSEMSLFPVTSSAVNTLRFLESNGLTEYFADKEDFVKITYCRFKDENKSVIDDTSTGMLSARCITKNYDFDVYYADGSMESTGRELPAYATAVTGKAEIEKLSGKIRAAAFMDDDGYYVKAEYRNGNYVLAYIPEAGME